MNFDAIALTTRMPVQGRVCDQRFKSPLFDVENVSLLKTKISKKVS